MCFHAVTFFVHLRNNSQMPNKLMTTKKQSELGLLGQVAIKRIKTIPTENHSFKKLHRKADDGKYSPAESKNTIQGVPTKNCNWIFMNCVYMLMYHFLTSSVFVNIHLLPRDLKEESL